MTEITFETWWLRFLHCAEEADFDVDPEDQALYSEYYDDGDTPEEALEYEMDAAAEIEKGLQ